MNDDHEIEAAETAKPSKKRRRKTSRSAQAQPVASPQPKGQTSLINALILALIALAAGAAGGWFFRGAKGSEAVSVQPDGAAAPAGSAGVCADWAQQVCAGVGDKAEACGQIKATAALLPEGACVAALANLPATVDKAKAARSSCDQLIDKACADLGKDTETCKMVTEKTATFPTAQCNQMLQNYDKVIVELKQMEKQNAPLSAAEATKIASGEVASYGPKDAKVTVVEFSDFECPYCSMAAETMKTLKEQYGDKVRFVFRHYPLPFHKSAQLVAEASMAALAQGKFWEFHDLVFANQKEIGRENLDKYAKDVGLDMAKFAKALDDKSYEKVVKDDIQLGESVGVGGTPSFFVGTKRVSEPSVKALSAAIDAQLEG